MNSKNRIIISNFVNAVLDRFQTKYEYNIFLEPEYLYNGVWTKPSLNLLRNLLHCFKETNLISFHIMNCKILSNRELLLHLLPNLIKRQKYLGDVIKPLLVFLGNSKVVSNFDSYAPILKTIYESKDDLSESILKLSIEKIYHVMIQTIRKSSNINNELPYIYYFASILDRFSKDDKMEEETDSTSSNQDSILKKKHFTIRKNFKSLLVNEILPQVFIITIGFTVVGIPEDMLERHFWIFFIKCW